MKKIRRQVAILVVYLVFLPLLVYSQEIQLRHKWMPGQVGKAQTQVEMKGDSFIADQKAATDLNMRLQQEYQVGSVDANGNADLKILTQRLNTQGKMNDSKFNEELTGEKLDALLYGTTKMNAIVSPLGTIQGKDEIPWSQMGISLPIDPASGGGFEFPTFPMEPVRVGDMWNDNGMLLQPNGIRSQIQSGDWVYQLKGVTISPQGRMAIIRYKKITDLSGLGLGNLDNPAAKLGNFGGAAQTEGLVIDLEGEIDFLIDRGLVLRTTQQGFWNLKMNAASAERRERTSLKQQGMRIRIQTQFQWFQPNQQLLRPTPTPIQPPVFIPPKVELNHPE